jgi:hypothetical protein
MTTKLTVTKVKTLNDGKHGDTVQPGLFLYVRHAGKSRVYQHRYTQHGKDVWVSIGPVRRIGLADARAMVARQRAMLLDGKDPRTTMVEAPTLSGTVSGRH